MPDFTPTQYEAREGRDTYIARSQGATLRVYRVDARDNQVDLGTAPNLAAANQIKADDRAVRTAAHIHAYVVLQAGGGVTAEVTNYAGFGPSPDRGTQIFASVAEFEAAYPELDLHGVGESGNRVYMTAAAGRGQGPP